jgi:hypothetical protein
MLSLYLLSKALSYHTSKLLPSSSASVLYAPGGCRLLPSEASKPTKGLVIVITMDRCAIVFLRFKHIGVICIIGTGSLSSKLSRKYSTVLSLAFEGCKAYAAKGREASRSRSSKQMPSLARSLSKAPPRPLNGPLSGFQARAHTWVAYSPSSASTARIRSPAPSMANRHAGVYAYA